MNSYRFLSDKEIGEMRANVSLIEKLLVGFPLGVIFYLQQNPFDPEIPKKLHEWETFFDRNNYYPLHYSLQSRKVPYLGEKFYSVGLFKGED